MGARLKLAELRKAVVTAFRSAHLQPLPLAGQLRGYDRKTARGDLQAGLSVALLAFPQGLAFAAIAGLPIVYGALATAVAAILGGLFSSSRLTILGPSNATAFLLFSFFAATPELAQRQQLLMPWLALLIGLVLVVSAVLHLSDYAQYISRSVIVGYLTGAALLVIANQAPQILGVALTRPGEVAPGSFFAVLTRLVREIPQVQWPPLALGVVTIALYLGLKKWRPAWPNFGLVLLLMTAVGQGMLHWLPGISLPTFQALDPQSLLPQWPQRDDHLLELLNPLFGAAFALAFLASLENSVMSRTLSGVAGQREVNGHQDTLSLGIANLGAAFVGGMPCSGSLTRSQLNFQSGAKTGVAAIVSGIAGLLLAWLLAGAVGWVPKAVLAALVIGVSIALIQPALLRVCLSATGSDAVVLAVTFLATLLMPLHVAIFVGVGTAVMLFLRKAAKPELAEYAFADDGVLRALGKGETRSQPAVSIVHVEGDLFFGAADVFRSQVEQIWQDPNLKVVVLRLRNARNMDATSILALADLVDFARAQGRHILLSGLRPHLFKILSRSGMVERIGRDNFFFNHPDNPNLATAKALKKATTLIGTRDAEVKIFVKKEDAPKKENGGQG